MRTILIVSIFFLSKLYFFNVVTSSLDGFHGFLMYFDFYNFKIATVIWKQQRLFTTITLHLELILLMRHILKMKLFLNIEFP